jgi:hypothetical protein
MKRLVALLAMTAFAFSVAGNYSLAATDKPADKPKTECKCGKDCTGDNCKCGCHKVKKPTDKDEA